MKIIGQIVEKTPELAITDNFSKAEIMVKTIEEYPNHYPIEFHNGNINHLDAVSVGDNVTVHCNLRGRLYTNKEGQSTAFITLVGWKLEDA